MLILKHFKKSRKMRNDACRKENDNKFYWKMDLWDLKKI